MPDLEFAEDGDRLPGRPVPMPRPHHGPTTGKGRWILLPSTGIPLQDPFRFTGSVGPNGDNVREDVIRAQVLLGNSGDYDLASLGAPTGWPGGELWRGIRKYQKRKGLTADGVLLPVGSDGVDDSGVGETLAALRNDLGAAFTGRRAPTPDEVDRHYDGPDRSSTEGDVQLPEIAVRDEDGTLLQYPLGTGSDVDAFASPGWRDDAQVAQALPLPPRIMPPPGGSIGVSPQNPYPHQQPDVQAAARQLERLLGNAAGNMANLQGAIQSAWNEGKSRDPRLGEAEQAAVTMMPADDAAKEASKPPPLILPKVEDKLKGRPAEEQKPQVEKLIPPEMNEWYEGLEPFDQELARQLLIAMNRRGDETMQQGNAIFVQKYLEVFTKEFGHVRGEIRHVGGGKDDAEQNVKEELLRMPPQVA